mmetsp:Transcript_26041/g.76360  ORF Transcript_26041/g.76360 Transcript_26041/m.76360 type:complete len:328 (-) Transcript_26041:400-1383(-)
MREVGGLGHRVVVRDTRCGAREHVLVLLPAPARGHEGREGVDHLREPGELGVGEDGHLEASGGDEDLGRRAGLEADAERAHVAVGRCNLVHCLLPRHFADLLHALHPLLAHLTKHVLHHLRAVALARRLHALHGGGGLLSEAVLHLGAAVAGGQQLRQLGGALATREVVIEAFARVLGGRELEPAVVVRKLAHRVLAKAAPVVDELAEGGQQGVLVPRLPGEGVDKGAVAQETGGLLGRCVLRRLLPQRWQGRHNRLRGHPQQEVLLALRARVDAEELRHGHEVVRPQGTHVLALQGLAGLQLHGRRNGREGALVPARVYEVAVREL